MSSTHAVFHPLTVAAIEPLTEDSVAITFDVPEELRDDYAYTHGQHITVRTQLADDDVRRNYSICSPVSAGVLRIAVKRLPGGAFSEHALEQLQVGDVIDVMTPSGRFFTELDPAHEKSYVCIAAGSGITPVLSIVATTLEVEPRSRVTLLYANRTHASVMFLEEVEDLKDRYPERFQLIHILSREPQEVELFSGRLDVPRMQRLLDSVIPPADVDEWFLCGPYEMVSTLRKQLIAEGVSKRAVHAEVFHVEPGPPVRRTPVESATAATGSEVTISLDGRRSTFPLATDGPSVLEAALTVRADAPFACKGGVCGTCRAKVVEGTVEMDTNWALEPDELERGYVLTCQSHPTSDKVVLDYDA
ncbi:MAG TPA: 1,2-phenylacetyl-CoA epoxidase subunit PaaE [Nocardioidaceae bacterium]|nr:1,2-phenylacetyl-CoA epoxidase subunit PaaE [Nocardioidaceae bacterium]